MNKTNDSNDSILTSSSKFNKDWKHFCNKINKKELLGKGTYGTVYKYFDSENNKNIAVKKIKMLEKEGMPTTSLREMTILKALDHPNILKLNDYYFDAHNIYLVFDHYPYDLRMFIEEFDYVKSHTVENIAYQLLNGINYLHSNLILHRDLKPSNILINPLTAEILIADFGLSRSMSPNIRPYSKEICTLFYRPPEILLGGDEYAMSIDIWSYGCILLELFIKQPVFATDNEFSQLLLILK
jgi:serine/threonine protein kinase